MSVIQTASVTVLNIKNTKISIIIIIIIGCAHRRGRALATLILFITFSWIQKYFLIYSDSIEKAFRIKPVLLEDGELEEGELDDDDDVDSKTDQPLFRSASDTEIQPSSNGIHVLCISFL